MPDPKLFVFFSLILILTLEIAGGHLKGFWSYCRSLSPKPFLLLLGASLLAAAAFMPFDESLRYLFRAYDPAFKESAIIRFFGFFGKYYGSWPILIGFYLISFILRQEPLKRMGFWALTSSGASSLVAHLIKHVFLRARPYKELGPWSFFDLHGFLADDRAFQSFPSGDVAVVAGATGYFFFACRNPFLRGLCLLIPIGTAIARVSLNKHWPSDTVFSIGLSLIVAKVFWDFQKSKSLNPSRV